MESQLFKIDIWETIKGIFGIAFSVIWLVVKKIWWVFLILILIRFIPILINRLIDKLKNRTRFKNDDNKKGKRNNIPKEVQREVWRRDGGRCVECGSQENLEFDHIIPISKGGSNTARNIQLLCEECNRNKSNKI